jgi:hypothetical protein
MEAPGVLESHLEASRAISPLGKEGLLQSPTGVRCRKPVAIAEGADGRQPVLPPKLFMYGLWITGV